MVLLCLALTVVVSQDGGDFGGDGDGGYGGYDGGDGGGGGGDGYGGGDDGFVGAADGGDDDGGSYDGTALHPVYAAPRMMTGPTLVLRRRRSLPDAPSASGTAKVHHRVRRGGYGVVGPVYTYVRTDYDGNFKWGARHHVGKSYGGHHGGGGYGGGHY